MSSPSILRPERTVKLSDGEVVVHDLPWHDALQFLKLLSSHAKDLLGNVGPDGRVNVGDIIPKLADLIGNVEELSTFLLTRSTGKSADWLLGAPIDQGRGREGGRSTLEVLALLDAALEVNLSDGLIELGKKVGGRLQRVLPSKTNATPPSAIS